MIENQWTLVRTGCYENRSVLYVKRRQETRKSVLLDSNLYLLQFLLLVRYVDGKE